MNVGWSIDGKPVDVISWDDATFSVPGGYEPLTLSIPRRSMPPSLAPFSVVQGIREDGVGFYLGQVAQVPQIVSGGVKLSLEGLQHRIERHQSRRLYATNDLGDWQTADSDPFTAGGYSMNEKYAVNVAGGAIHLNITPASYTSGLRAGVLMWTPSEIITRITFTIRRDTGNGNFDIRIYTGTGPTGALTLDTTQVLTGTGTINMDVTLAAPSDLVGIFIAANGSASPADRIRTTLDHVTVYGRVTATTFSLSDLSADLADVVNFDDLSPSQSADILPQDWKDTSWADATTAAAELQDATWYVDFPFNQSSNPAGLYVGPFDDDLLWGVSESDGADYSGVQPMMPANKVVVAWDTPAGATKHVSATPTTDPYSASGATVVWPSDGPYKLEGQHHSSAKADAVAAAFMAYYARPHVRGEVKVNALRTGHPWDIRPGGFLHLSDYEQVPWWQDELPTQRVQRVTRHLDGTATVGIGEDISLDALLARRRHRRRHHHHRGGHHR